MDWNELSKIKKFTPLEDVYAKFGEPRFQLGWRRQILYFGQGFLISYLNQKYRIENDNKIYYGETGVYAFSVYYFINRKDLEINFLLRDEKYDFEGEILGNDIDITDNISTRSTFEEVSKYLKANKAGLYYSEGQTRSPEGPAGPPNANTVFRFRKNNIRWGPYEFMFFNHSENANFRNTKKSKLSAFHFILSE